MSLCYYLSSATVPIEEVSMDFDYLEWIEFMVRWFHVIAGIAWIGSSFYFIALDLSLRKSPSLPKEAHGEAWQVHGGGFYNLVTVSYTHLTLPTIYSV